MSKARSLVYTLPVISVSLMFWVLLSDKTAVCLVPTFCFLISAVLLILEANFKDTMDDSITAVQKVLLVLSGLFLSVGAFTIALLREHFTKRGIYICSSIGVVTFFFGAIKHFQIVE
eukprot:GHVP01014713.1.p1 GENE.GHVP01014713.1~~GHVP01014713.1.p1  ORF type:complete len:117 (-),score=11.86 GHVP01014713.1:330-680(-)